MAKRKSRAERATENKRLASRELAPISFVDSGEPLRKPLLTERERRRRLRRVKTPPAFMMGEPPSKARPILSKKERGVDRLKPRVSRVDRSGAG